MRIHPFALGRLFHTVRFLKPIQIYGRIGKVIKKVRPDWAPPPPLRHLGSAWQPPIAPERSLFDGWRFQFLNVTHTLAPPTSLATPSAEKLWLYNLHYFADLNTADAANRRAQHQAWLNRWINEVDASTGCAWEPYPTSLRIVNWAKWLLSGGTGFPALHHSLAVQARYLEHRLETHLLGNHLFENGKALIFAGVLFTGPEAERWLNKGARILHQQLAEQILPDGGHCELSPMYHAQILEGLLDLINLAQAAESVLRKTIDDLNIPHLASRMLLWLDTMVHPNGDISFFNDAALGIAPSHAQLAGYAKSLGLHPPADSPRTTVTPLRITQLADSGYIRMAWTDAMAILDTANIGPDYLPAHGHADTLSFELSIGQQRILVNSGTSCYGDSAERLRQRGTAAHNTLTVDDENSSEVWGGFRVARRAYPVNLAIGQDAECVTIRCSHTGYLRLPGKVTHHRNWLGEQNALTVHDQLSGQFGHAEAHFHFHPEIRITSGGEHVFHLSKNGVRLAQIEITSCRSATIYPSTWHPGFGLSLANQKLIVRLQGNELLTRFTW